MRAVGSALNSPVGLAAMNGFFFVSAITLGSNVLGKHIRGAADVHGNHVRGAVKQGTGVLGAVYAGVAGLGGAVTALFKVRVSCVASNGKPWLDARGRAAESPRGDGGNAQRTTTRR